MTEINQKEYLKKYLGIGKNIGDKKKKKKKKMEKIVKDRIQIIDDDMNANAVVIDDEPLVNNEDAPQIVAIIDERPPSLRIDEKTKNHLWQPIGTVDDSNKPEPKLFSSGFKIGKKEIPKLPQQSALKSSKKSKHKNNADQGSDSRRRNSPEILDDSPVREIKREVITPENSPPRRITDDASPPRKIKREDDASPPRRGRNDDNSPPRRNLEEDSSPPRNRNNDDASPPRRNRKDDMSPPRRSRQTDDSSPPRRGRQNDDASPPRRRRQDDDVSPPRKNKQNDDVSPPRRSRRDSDPSPPRRNRRNSDPSPPRRNRREDTSPLRRNKRDDDASPPRKNRKVEASPPRRNRKKRWDNSPPKENPGPSRSPSRHTSEKSERMSKTLDGRVAGLQNAQQLVEENRRFRKKEDELFKNMSSEVSGRNASTIVRTKGSGRVRDTEEDEETKRKKKEEEEKQKEKYARWGRGLAQVESRQKKIEEELHEMSKPLARYADDEDLERYLKEQEREGDPMLAYIRKKKRKDAASKGIVEKPQFEGEFMPNRYGIRPGHRWDGVDRSNGYEKKWFEIQNAKTAQLEESYKWSTEDM